MEFNGTPATPRTFNAPLFVVWNEGDIKKIIDFLGQNKKFNDLQWVTDRHNNPLCRVGLRQQTEGKPRAADRVCNIVCRKAHMKDIVDYELKMRIARG